MANAKRLPTVIVSLTLLTLLVNAGTALAQTYYVRAGATGTNSGASWTDAFSSLPATMVRGATYYVASGTYIGNVVFNTPESGSSYIYIKKATIDAHGSESGWNPTYANGTAEFVGTWSFSTGYWDIDGVTGGGPGASVAEWPGVWKNGHGIAVTVTAGSNGVIDLRNATGRSGFRFRHLRLTSQQPVNATGTSYGRIFWLERSGQSNASNVLVEYVYVPDFQGVPFHVWGAHDWTIQYSYFEGNGVGNNTNVHRELWSGVGNDRWVFRWNYILNQVNSAVWALVNGGGTTDSVEIYGNIVDYGQGRSSAGTLIDAVDTGNESVTPTNWRIFNNTIVGWSGGGPLVWLSSGGNNYFRNNIFANMSTSYGPDIRVTHKSHNGAYNIIRQPPWAGNETGAWAAAMGSNTQVFASDPFVGYTTRDLRLRAPTTAGTLEGSPDGNSRDMFGNLRGADGTVDRGALEHTGEPVSPSLPAAPANLRLVQ